jgi:hypothetical protein
VAPSFLKDNIPAIKNNPHSFQYLITYFKYIYPPLPKLPHNPASLFWTGKAFMDWPLIVERNRERLLAVLAPLFAVLGFDPRRAALARHMYRAFLITLRPAESAMRRLIIIAAHGLVVKLRLSAARTFPAGLGLKLRLALEKDAERVPAFCLIDPLKRFAPVDFEWAKEWSKEQVMPRISVPDLIDPVFEDRFIPMRDDPIDCAALRRRRRALKDVLDNLPCHARRLARWRARGELARMIAPKPSRLSPFRPGFAPGYHRHEPNEIDVILGDCHYFAVEAWRGPDTS